MNDQAVVIHSAKLPATVSLDDLLIRPLDGITTAANPERAGWRYLAFRSFALEWGETSVVPYPDQETIVITLGGGGVRIEYATAPAMDLPGRTSVFSGLPWAAYVPPRSGAVITGRPWVTGGRSVVALAQAPSSGRVGSSPLPIRIGPDDVEIEVRGPATQRAR